MDLRFRRQYVRSSQGVVRVVALLAIATNLVCIITAYRQSNPRFATWKRMHFAKRMAQNCFNPSTTRYIQSTDVFPARDTYASHLLRHDCNMFHWSGNVSYIQFRRVAKVLKHPKSLVAFRVPSAAELKGLIATAVIAAAFVSVNSDASDLDNATRLLRAGKHAEAMKVLDAGLKIDANAPQLRFTKGLVLMEQKRTQEAIAIFLKLSEDYPDLPEPYNNLAVLYSQDNQFEKARTALNMAIKTNASYATALANLGDIHARMAAQSYGKAMNVQGQNVGTQSKLQVLTAFAVPVPPAAATIAAVNPPAIIPPPAAVAKMQQLPESALPKTAAKPAAPIAAIAPSKPDGSTAVTPVPSVKRDVQPAKEESDVADAVSAWVKAWAEKDMDAYLAAYENNYYGSGTKNHAAWVKLRKTRILGKDSIVIKIENQKVELDGDTAVVSFRQIYTGGTVTSDDLKTLTFKKKSGKWKITKETTAT